PPLLAIEQDGTVGVAPGGEAPFLFKGGGVGKFQRAERAGKGQEDKERKQTASGLPGHGAIPVPVRLRRRRAVRPPGPALRRPALRRRRWARPEPRLGPPRRFPPGGWDPRPRPR